MRIQVRKCPFTGKIFEEKDLAKYKKHLRDLRKEMSAKRELVRLRANFDEWLAEEKLKITHPDQIGPWILENQQRLMDASNAGCGRQTYGYRGDVFKPGDKFTKLSLNFHDFSPTVGNTHHAPRGKITNFTQVPEKPRSYPGWTGRVDGVLEREKKNMGSYPYSNILNMLDVLTGSGGGGNEHWGYDVRIFLEDWPGFDHLRIEYEQNQLIRKLKRGY